MYDLVYDPEMTPLLGLAWEAGGKPIGGLYAAGNTMAAVTGTVYPGGGIPIGASMLFSHLAALHMTTRISSRRN